MLFGIEKEMHTQLTFLKNTYSLHGIKAEFEAEGSCFRDLVRLRRITLNAGIPLYLKIGGVEAVRDLKDAAELGVDGIIAPMVESKFGVKKFIEAKNKIYRENDIHSSLNIETKTAVEAIDDILEYSIGKINNITIGRTDLSASFFRDEIVPDSDHILDIVETIIGKTKGLGITVTMGGSLSQRTISCLQSRPVILDGLFKLETRKVILPTRQFIREGAVNAALKFEELYILSKKEFSDIFIEAEMGRLTQLKRRT
jgi:4-hydroxy-2-oxoheptanedioate aldolase